MKIKSAIPINTLDRALDLARALSHELANPESKAFRSKQIFSSLASNEPEGLAAFLIWRARGEILRELIHHT